MPDYLLNFELCNQKDELFIHANEEGLQFLISELNKLLSQTKEGNFDHVHLMTEEWAGTSYRQKVRVAKPSIT
jgi:hypothetical protein